MVLYVKASDQLVEVIKCRLGVLRLGTLQMKPGEIVDERLLQLCLFSPVSFHQGAHPSGVLSPLPQSETASVLVKNSLQSRNITGRLRLCR